MWVLEIHCCDSAMRCAVLSWRVMFPGSRDANAAHSVTLRPTAHVTTICHHHVIGLPCSVFNSQHFVIIRHHQAVWCPAVPLDCKRAALSAADGGSWANRQREQARTLVRRAEGAESFAMPECLKPQSAETKQKEAQLRALKGKTLIESCGKLQLLDRLLTRVLAAGSRVLLFSQYTLTLDVLCEYCAQRFGPESQVPADAPSHQNPNA
eukprot:2238024-Rhodomonas_salina.2